MDEGRPHVDIAEPHLVFAVGLLAETGFFASEGRSVGIAGTHVGVRPTEWTYRRLIVLLVTSTLVRAR